MDYKEDNRFSNLYDIIGSSSATKKQREDAWQKLSLIEDSLGFSIIIAAKFSWLEFSDEYKKKAWQKLPSKPENEEDLIWLHYLAVNAPEPWSKSAGNLEEKLKKKLLSKKNKK